MNKGLPAVGTLLAILSLGGCFMPGIEPRELPPSVASSSPAASSDPKDAEDLFRPPVAAGDKQVLTGTPAGMRVEIPTTLKVINTGKDYSPGQWNILTSTTLLDKATLQEYLPAAHTAAVGPGMLIAAQPSPDRPPTAVRARDALLERHATEITYGAAQNEIGSGAGMTWAIGDGNTKTYYGAYYLRRSADTQAITIVTKKRADRDALFSGISVKKG